MIQVVRVKNNDEKDRTKVYRLEGISEKQAKILAENLLCEEISQNYTINKPIFSNAIEIAYKPGVMNPEVASIIKAASDLGIKLLACDSSREYLNKAPVFNPLIEDIVKKEPKTLLIKGIAGKTKIIPLRQLTNNELMALSQDKLFLSLEEMKVIQKYFQKIKKDPTDCELETLAQTWSEHSGHKTFKSKIVVDGEEKEPLITRIKNEALKHKKNIVSAFVDNSGVMDFYDDFAICGKGETHNAPSAIEPYGGAMTGSGGVFRDIAGTGQGAKNVISQDVFCFAPPDYPTEKLPPGTLPPKYLLERVVAGVRDYGNRMGIPTNNGSIHFHEDFRARPTVFVGAYGIMPKKYAKKGIPKKGDLIVVVGGKTGRDGIHGATFSSGEMSERTKEVNATAVQIGNPIEEKRMFDALLEARDENLIRAMQDVGGGGFSSAIGEIGEELGVSVDMKKAPLKYQGLSPWEIWVSESQERMIVVLEKKSLKKFVKICQKYNTQASVLGKFDGSRKLNVTFGKDVVCNLDMQFLHHGLPKKLLKTTKPKSHPERAKRVEGSLLSQKEWIRAIEKVLESGDVCSKEPIVRMYDHTVQGTSVLPPFTGVAMDGPNDAVVIRPLLNKPYGMIVSHGLNPALNNIDPYWGSIWAATEAISNYAAVGGDYKEASLINNYVWPFPDEESLWSLDQSVDAVVDFMKVLKIPVISGKDSLSSTYRGSDGVVIKIPPVLIMSVFGKIPDVKKTVSSDFKKIGSTIVLVGKQDLKILPKVLDTIYQAIQTGQVLSCHDISEGGLITALFEMCLGGGMGAVIKQISLFNETAGTFLVEVENETAAKRLFANVPYVILGKTQKQNNIKVEKLFEVSVAQLAKAWKKPMEEIFS
ncbi:phosphoribosylformylglycinamidine synthase [Candidatus Daviesbacteria bacterium]|nr:phosphoribosylformylglycinamidine synthase [Candidatus Daviesbacteria bacterium]